MMQFKVLTLHQEGLVQATATGHPTDVIEAFRKVCELLLSGKGAWRITKVEGNCSPDEPLDSSMEWNLLAVTK